MGVCWGKIKCCNWQTCTQEEGGCECCGRAHRLACQIRRYVGVHMNKNIFFVNKNAETIVYLGFLKVMLYMLFNSNTLWISNY